MVEDGGEGLEDESGARVGVDAVGKAGGENDETRGEGHEGIQHRHVDGLPHEGAILTQVAAEDGHRADAQAQGEESLVHGGHDDVEDARLFDVLDVGDEVELQSLGGTLQEDTVDGDDHHEDEERHHHDLGDPLQALLDAQHTDRDANDDGGGHEDGLPDGVAQHIPEFCFDGLGIQALELARGGLDEVVHHPTGHVVVEHHEDDTAHEAGDAVDVPLGLGRLQRAEHDRGGPLGSAAHGELHGHDGDTQDDEAGDVDEDEDGTAVLAYHPREFPYVTDADGATGGEEDEAQAACESVTGHGRVSFE